MATPEKKVKEKVKRILEELGAYYFSPATGHGGRKGIPDIIACYKGKFVGIECKAGKNKPTKLQQIELNKIQDAEGIAIVANEATSSDDLEKILNGRNKTDWSHWALMNIS